MTTTTSGNVTFVGTLPTTYSPAAACTAITSEEVVGIDFASTCLPDNFDTAPSAYYSPGWECPDGYHAPSSCTRSASSGATAHTITCCPSRSNVALTCVENPSSLANVWSTLFCTWSAGSQETVLLVTSTSTDSSTSTVITSAVTMSGADGINAYGIRMVWEDSDRTTSTTNARTTDTGTTATETAPATTSTGSSDSGSEASSGGLSTGAIAAIAVVVPLFAIAALVSLFFWFRRRKQRQQQATSELYGGDAAKELPSDALPGELYGSLRAPQELESPSIAVELPADTPNAHETRTVSSPGLSSGGVSKAESPTLSTASPVGSHGRR